MHVARRLSLQPIRESSKRHSEPGESSPARTAALSRRLRKPSRPSHGAVCSARRTGNGILDEGNEQDNKRREEGRNGQPADGDAYRIAKPREGPIDDFQKPDAGKAADHG